MDLARKVIMTMYSKGSVNINESPCRKSNTQERQAAVQAGLTFIELRQLPAKTRVTRVNMGGEPEEFKSLFTNW